MNIDCTEHYFVVEQNINIISSSRPSHYLSCTTNRIKNTERVHVIYPDDTYGPIAASAFVRAVGSTIGINVNYNAAGQTSSTIDIASA